MNKSLSSTFSLCRSDCQPSLLTNTEVLAVLKERGSNSSASEKEVEKYLDSRKTPLLARQELENFISALKSEFNISSKEIVQLLNHSPESLLEAYLCLESAINGDSPRLEEEDLERVLEKIKEHFCQQN